MGIYNPSNNPTYTTSNNLPNNKKKATPSAEAFRISIKKDRSTYPIFREDRQWDKWNQPIKDLARTHSCEDIFDPTYTSNGADKKVTFIEKFKFIYSVYEDKVLTNTGQALVCKFEKTFDAQSVYKGLLKYSRESTQTTIDIAELLIYITSVTLHNIPHICTSLVWQAQIVWANGQHKRPFHTPSQKDNASKCCCRCTFTQSCQNLTMIGPTGKGNYHMKTM